jgi:hypothetical protein
VAAVGHHDQRAPGMPLATSDEFSGGIGSSASHGAEVEHFTIHRELPLESRAAYRRPTLSNLKTNLLQFAKSGPSGGGWGTCGDGLRTKQSRSGME